MAKPYKIKRYQKIYKFDRNSRVTPFSIVMTVVIFAALVFVGVSIYEPIYNFVVGNIITDRPPIQPPKPIQTDKAPVETTVTVKKEPEVKTDFNGKYLSPEVFTNSAALEAFMSEDEFDTAFLVIKDETGNLFYQSQIDYAAPMIAPTAIDLKATVDKLEENNIRTVVVINTFKDRIAPVNVLGSSIMYMQTKMKWLDNYPELGGKLWLNPYAVTAQSYIKEIVSEVLDYGVSGIVMDSMQFPTGVGLELANYGSSTKTKSALLSEFSESLINLAAEKSIPLFVNVNYAETLSATEATYGGNPLNISNQIMLSITENEMISDIGKIKTKLGTDSLIVLKAPMSANVVQELSNIGITSYVLD